MKCHVMLELESVFLFSMDMYILLIYDKLVYSFSYTAHVNMLLLLLNIACFTIESDLICYIE